MITGARNEDYDMFDKLDKPFVLFGENHRGYDFVDTDNQTAEKMAPQYALDRLYKHIIFIGLILKNHLNIHVKRDILILYNSID